MLRTRSFILCPHETNKQTNNWTAKIEPLHNFYIPPEILFYSTVSLQRISQSLLQKFFGVCLSKAYSRQSKGLIFQTRITLIQKQDYNSLNSGSQLNHIPLALACVAGARKRKGREESVARAKRVSKARNAKGVKRKGSLFSFFRARSISILPPPYKLVEPATQATLASRDKFSKYD